MICRHFRLIFQQSTMTNYIISSISIQNASRFIKKFEWRLWILWPLMVWISFCMNFKISPRLSKCLQMFVNGRAFIFEQTLALLHQSTKVFKDQAHSKGHLNAIRVRVVNSSTTYGANFILFYSSRIILDFSEIISVCIILGTQ